MPRDASVGVRNAAVLAATDGPGPWKAWRTRSLHGRAIRFIGEFCVPSKGHRFGKPLRLAEWQKEWLEEVLQPGVDSSVLTLPRGNGKSTFVGAVATWALFDEAVAEQFGGRPDIPVIAPSLRQARKGCYGAACDFRRSHPELVARSIRYTASGEERIVVPSSQGELYPAAANEETLQGFDPLLALVDEVGFISVAAWDALLLSAGKRPRNLILALGTRNPSDDPNALDSLLAANELHGGVDGFVLVDYSADPDASIDDHEQWNRANPALKAGYLRLGALEQARKLSPTPAFKTFRLNLKSGSHTGWLGVSGPAHWDATQGEVLFSATEPMYLGVDKSAYSDSSAVVQLQQLGDRWLIRARIFVPDPTIDHAAVRAHIRSLCAEYAIAGVGYDDRYFVEGADELAAEGLPMLQVPQNPARLVPAYSYLYAAFVEHRIVHDDDPAFRAHVLGAVAVLDRSGGFTLAKGRSKVKIDAAVALGIARSVADVAEVELELGLESLKVW
jgi:phage terminase large subunit-like protein